MSNHHIQPTEYAVHYWLMKSEPSVYSIDDLAKDRRTAWNGVRSYQARNHMRAMKKGDLVLFYHSSSDPSGVAGLARVVKEAYPDPTQFDKKSEYHDGKSTNNEMPHAFLLKKREREPAEVVKLTCRHADCSPLPRTIRCGEIPSDTARFCGWSPRVSL